VITRDQFTEQHHFILEAAMQLGFEVIDEDVTMFRVSDEAIIEFATRIARATIEQIAERLPSQGGVQ